ncbi:MAG: cell wall-binding repeat-containing protein, partial [Actinomycetota bacterium]|nr:cell wall-binding repeat-containing protein [Actinomycetota bacterium]
FKTAYSGDSELNATGMRPGIGVFSVDEFSPGTTETPGATFELEMREVPGPAAMPSPPGWMFASDVYDVSLDELVFLPPFDAVTSNIEPMLDREPIEDLASFPELMIAITPDIVEAPPAEPFYYDEAMGSWMLLSPAAPPNPETGEIVFHPIHFSQFALMRPLPGPGVSADTTPPLEPWRLAGTASGPDVTLTWSNPTDPDFAGTEVWHSDTHYADSILDVGGMFQMPSDGRTPFAVDEGRPDGLHYYSVFSTDIAGNWSDGAYTVVRVGDPMSTPIQGSNRFTTAVQASQQAFPADDSLPLDPEGHHTVVVATGRNWPDALGGSSLAGAVGGPLLLADTNALPSYVGDEITRLGADRVMLLGGEAAVSSDVFGALEDLSVDVERISGSNRFSTAEKIADRTVELLDTEYDGVALVATGRAFPDALAGSPLAAGKVWPIYLSDTSGLHTSTMDQITDDGVTDVIVLGGEAAVPASVITQLESTLSGDVDRLWGSDRYATAAAIASYAVDSAHMHWDGVAMATGTDFPDAMSGGVLQGLDGSVVLLTKSSSLSSASQTALESNGYRIYEVRFLGGEVAISTAVRAAVMTAIK